MGAISRMYKSDKIGHKKEQLFTSFIKYLQMKPEILAGYNKITRKKPTGGKRGKHMRIKKLLALVLTAAMAVGLAACGSEEENAPVQDVTEAVEAEHTESETVTEPEQQQETDAAETEEAAAEDSMTQEEFDALDKTTVIKSAESPTGYYVTFRYKDADASRVRLYGEWRFSDLEHATYFTSLNASPEEWKDGYTVWQTDGWPTVDMEKNEATGVWSYTIPLPTGTWCYRYYVDGAEGAELTDYTDARLVADPANVNYLAGDVDPENLSREEALTAVYVPYDEEKQANTPARPEEAPRDGENGTVLFEEVTTESGVHTSYGIYLPYDFDETREDPYPLLVLFHGGGGYDGSWLTNGLANILDNMIAEGRMEPTIVVTPNASDFSESFNWDRPAILDFVTNTILPDMAENYNASSDPARRAFAGLSMGGATTGYAMFHHTDDFDTYVLFSAPMTNDIEPDYSIPELKDKNIFIGYGDYDFVVGRSLYYLTPDADGNLVPIVNNKEGSILEYLHGLSEAGVEFRTLKYPYGHDWVLWRELIVDVFDEVLWK